MIDNLSILIKLFSRRSMGWGEEGELKIRKRENSREESKDFRKWVDGGFFFY